MKQIKQTWYFSGREMFSGQEFAAALQTLVFEYYKKNGPCPILFLCIGSDRITGDSLGPLVGYKLTHESQQLPCRVWGTLSHPVHALNLRAAAMLLRRPSVPFLTVAIDAAVGHSDSLGQITLCSRPLSPGEGIHRRLPRVGQFSVTGVVGGEEADSPLSLQHIRLGPVMELADCICDGILTFLYSCSSQLPAPDLIPDFPGRSAQVLPVSACASDPFQDGFHRYL